MGDKTGIQWTDATWNPIRGCSRVSEGCRNCYAETVANRFKGPGQPYEGLIAKGGQWNGRITVVDSAMEQPLRWRKPRRIFVNSMSDLFHENVPYQVIDQVFAVMAMALVNNHKFQILTKRPQRMLEYLNDNNLHGRIIDAAREMDNARGTWITEGYLVAYRKLWPLPNVWLGVSVEDQKTADERIPLLLQTPAAVRWISAEPLIGPIDFSGMWVPHENPAMHWNMLEALDWVVVGGESGANARPMHLYWARTLRDQCQSAGTPFFFKQWGEHAPNWFCDEDGKYNGGPIWMDRMGKKRAGRLLDGREWNEYPEVATT